MGGSLNGSARQIIKTGAGAGRVLSPTESTSTMGGAGTRTGGRPGAEGRTNADGTTGGITTAYKDSQKDIVKSKAEEPGWFSCVKGCSRGAAEVSVDPTDADAWGDPHPHEMGVVDSDRG
jgi:hypothetical protein